MNYDKYFHEMGNAIVVSGFKGFLVYRLVRRTSETLLPVKLGALGWVLGITVSAYMDASLIKLSTLFFVTLFLAVQIGAIVVLGLMIEWGAMVRAGLVKNAPRWENWRRWREEKRRAK